MPLALEKHFAARLVHAKVVHLFLLLGVVLTLVLVVASFPLRRVAIAAEPLPTRIVELRTWRRWRRLPATRRRRRRRAGCREVLRVARECFLLDGAQLVAQLALGALRISLRLTLALERLLHLLAVLAALLVVPHSLRGDESMSAEAVLQSSVAHTHRMPHRLITLQPGIAELAVVALHHRRQATNEHLIVLVQGGSVSRSS